MENKTNNFQLLRESVDADLFYKASKYPLKNLMGMLKAYDDIAGFYNDFSELEIKEMQDVLGIK